MTRPLAAVDFGGAVTDGFRTFATFIPKLIGFLLILIIGYFIAKVISKVVDKLLQKAGFDRAVERGGIKKALAKSNYDASDIVAKIVFFAIFIPVLSAAIGQLGIAALQAPLAAFITLIPKILVALVLVVIGAAIAGALKKLITDSLGGLSYGSALGTAASALVLVLFVKAALDEVGIATNVTSAVLYTVLATIAGVTIVGVGGGLIRPMQSRWEQNLSKASQETDRMKTHVQSSKQSSQQGQQQDQQYSQQQDQQYSGQQQGQQPAYPNDQYAGQPYQGQQGSTPVAPPTYDAPTSQYGQPRQ